MTALLRAYRFIRTVLIGIGFITLFVALSPVIGGIAFWLVKTDTNFIDPRARG